MKIILAIAATLVAFTPVSAGSAKEPTNRHIERPFKPDPDPNKTLLPDDKQMWIKGPSALADCDCAIMQHSVSAAKSNAMPDNGATPFNG